MNQDINYWIARCASLEQELDIMKEQSIVKWHTGEPKESGVYLVSISTEIEKSVTVLNWDNKEGKFLFVDFVPYITNLAWCKLSEIKPYKEELK